MADNAELLQRIELLESLITADYTPPEGPEHSFPVTGQGVTSSQYRQMMLAQGNGIIHSGLNPYRLVGHETEAETNQSNTMIVRADRSEAVIGGYFHRLTEDLEVPLPAVTVATTYHVCLTYDPAKESEPAGPISVQVYDGTPPDTGGREHVVIATVARQPSQVLTQAVVTDYRQHVSPVIGVQTKDQLPALTSVRYGTLAYTSGAELYTARSDRWDNVLAGNWQELTPLNGWAKLSSLRGPHARLTSAGVQLGGFAGGAGVTQSKIGGTDGAIARLPEWMRRSSHVHRFNVAVHPHTNPAVVQVGTDGYIYLVNTASTAYTSVCLDGIMISRD